MHHSIQHGQPYLPAPRSGRRAPSVFMTVLLLACCMLLPAVASIALCIGTLQNRLQLESDRNRDRIRDGVALQLEETMTSIAQSLDIIAITGANNADDATRWSRMLRSSRAHGKTVIDFAVANRGGEIISSTTAYGSAISVADRRYFLESQTKDHVVAGEGVVSRSTGRLALHLARAVPTSDLGAREVIIAGFDCTLIGDMLKRAGTGPGSDASLLVLDLNGHSIFSHDPQRLLSNFTGLDEQALATLRANPSDTLELHDNQLDTSIRAVIVTDDGLPLAYVLSAGQKNANTFDDVFKGMLYLLAGTVGVALLALLFAHRRIVLPLEQLMNKMRDIESGSHQPVKPVAAVREISDLHDTMERMAKAIQNREEDLAWMASHDDLTGLANRKALLEHLDSRLEAFRNGSAVPPLSVAFIDIDRFKAVNDSLGHHWGDLAIAAFAARLATHMDQLQAFCARVGGDEFVIVGSPEVSPQIFMHSVRRLLRSFATPLIVGQRMLSLRGSAGLLFVQDHNEIPDLIVRNANAAMHRSKERGRGRISLFKPRHLDRFVQGLDIERDLPGALAKGQLRMVYQPVVHAVDGRIHGVESLIRWDHPKYGPISPATFIPVAEQAGRINDLGNFVLSEVAACIKRFANAGLMHGSLLFGINISPAQLSSPDFVADVLRILTPAALPRNSVVLELTESALLSIDDEITGKLDILSAHGFRFAIDDYGAGYSNIQYLANPRFKTIKIDKSLVDDLTTNPRVLEIVRSTVTLAHNLQSRVVAEGVETLQQAAALRDMGCDFLQGFHYSRPIEEKEAMHLIRRLKAQRLPLPVLPEPLPPRIKPEEGHAATEEQPAGTAHCQTQGGQAAG